MTLRAIPSTPSSVTLLVLGAGWTWQFLQPLLLKEKMTYAATTTTGHDGTIQFKFDPDSNDIEAYKALPKAKYVLVTFPLKGKGPSARLVECYNKTHSQEATKWIQLGSTGIFTADGWNDSSSPIDTSNERGIAENELIDLGGCVLNLAGLYGASRQPGNWIGRVAKTQEQLASKGALHLIHGADVARGVIGVVKGDPEGTETKGTTSLFGRRWIVADCVSYDWWLLVWELMGSTSEDEDEVEDKSEERTKYRGWVVELMEESGIRGLPRPMDALGRKLDARDFWKAIGSSPRHAMAR